MVPSLNQMWMASAILRFQYPLTLFTLAVTIPIGGMLGLVGMDCYAILRVPVSVLHRHGHEDSAHHNDIIVSLSKNLSSSDLHRHFLSCTEVLHLHLGQTVQ